MMAELRTQTNTLTFKWLAGILLGICFSLVAFWARDLSGQVSALAAVVREGAIETAVMRGTLMETNYRLKRIEDNQDAAVMTMGRRR
jgi:hypothetical protein